MKNPDRPVEATSAVEARFNAQQIALAPLIFQAARLLRDLGILKALKTTRTGLTLEDMDLIELNESFAAQVLACTREWGFAERDFDRVNVNGSGISLGHPVGATGVRIMATMLHEMERRDVERR